MALRDLIPWNNGSRNMSLQRNEGDRFLVMHRAMNRLFDDAFRSFDVGAFGSQAIGWPSVEVSETEFTTRHAAPAEPSRLQEVIDALLDVEEPITEDPFYHVQKGGIAFMPLTRHTAAPSPRPCARSDEASLC